jgi:hypothetical protein
MAEPTQIMFSHKEVVTALLKEQGIHEGIWMLAMQFGFAAANVGSSEGDLNPAAIVPVIKIGVQRAETQNSLSVDAADVNPGR